MMLLLPLCLLLLNESVGVAGFSTFSPSRQQQQQRRHLNARGSTATWVTAPSSSPAAAASMLEGVQVFQGKAGPSDAPPLYDDSGLLDKTLLALFRSKLREQTGLPESPEPGYAGLMELITDLNSMYPDTRGTQVAGRNTLKALFPSWLPGAFAVMFSKPLPAFSSRMNAWVTKVASQWLMGPSEVNDVEIDGGSIGVGHGLKVERCRFLEEAGCASVCINSCKIPTQEFFIKDMGLPLEMTPNYEDFSCQFSFGKTPLPTDADDAFKVACFQQCPAQGSLRGRCHKVEEPDPTRE